MATKKAARSPRASNGNGNGGARTEREQRPLECKLSAAEFNDRSDKMAAAELLIEQLKEQRKGVNGKIAAAATERARLAHIIESQIEVRAVECEWRDDLRQNLKRLVRLDTNAEVDSRPLTADDLQQDLSLALPPVDSIEAQPAAAAPAKRGRGRPRKNAAPALEMHAHG